MSRAEEVFAHCTNVLPGHGPRRAMKAIFQTLADGLQGDEYSDRYGEGEYVSGFEAEIAELFGKEAAVFMPSGTMAQQIALRIWCETRNNLTVAMHPTAHPETAEHLGYQHLHQIKRIQFSAPELLGSRILTVRDLEKVGQRAGRGPAGAALPSAGR